MNKILLIGRLCNNPELRYVGEKNSAVTEFGLAVTRDFKNSEGTYDTDFIDCDLWGRRAEVFCKYMSKGELVGIDGKLRLNKYINKNGENRIKTKVFVNEFHFIPSSKRSETDSSTYNSKDVFPENVFEGEISESDIPF